VNSLRIFFLGGLTSYRALFNWITPWVLIPTFVIAPVTQILLFVYIGRQTATAPDAFFVIGNAVEYTAVPCLFAAATTVAGERTYYTLSFVLLSPAGRLPLILGRSLPVLFNGLCVSMFGLLVGGLLVGIHVPLSAYGPVLLAMAASSFACTGLGLMAAAVGLRVRDTNVLSSFLVGTLLIFCGINVPQSSMPAWMVGVGNWLPLTHGVEAARAVAAGATVSQVSGQLLTEVALGAGYLILGLAVLHGLERQSRRAGTLERT
jgi:ABC-2 type transport system permease protein